MSLKEKHAWLTVIASAWGMLLFYTTAPAILGGQADGYYDYVQFMGWMAGGMTAGFLLILSWRMAYLKGRGNQ